jgi:hypothetical protein
MAITTATTLFGRIDQWVTWFTPDTDGLDQRQRAAYRLLTYVCLITTAFALLYVSVSAWVGYTIGIWLMLADFVLLWAILFLFRSTALFRLSANLYLANSAFVAILGCSYYSGGLDSPVLPWFTLVPVAAVLLLGYGRDALLWLLMLLARNISVAIGKVAIGYYRSYRDDVPAEWIERPARTFMNLLEVPVLFYVACLLMLVTRECDRAQVLLAGAFVATRALHAAIYIGINHVPTRFGAYLAGCVTLGVIWFRLAASLL